MVNRDVLRLSLIVLLVMWGCISFCGCAYEKQADGITIRLSRTEVTDAALMKIQLYTDGVVHVTATPEHSFDHRPSLIAVDVKRPPVHYSVKRQGDSVVLSTAKMSTKVSLLTGQVAFYDHDGKLILQEKAGGGKTFTPAVVMDEATYHVRQVFQSSPDEAFYGLGQHQNGLMNYKGHNVDLKQYNIVASVPFLVSSRNYGILWDNTSRTKFGDIRDYQPLSESLTLYDKDGKKGGLTAAYYTDTTFGSLFTSRDESVINHESLQDQDGYPEGFKPNWSASIRWSGEIQSNESGVHTFRLYSSHYAKLWLNGKLVVDSWRQNWCPWERIVTLDMEAGKRYPITLEWIPNDGYIGLKHLGPPPAADKNTLSLYSEVGEKIDYYFMVGNNADEVIGGYRIITGKAPMMPSWAMGMWQCRERYKTQDELLDVVKTFRERHIPLDAIVQDWFYWPEDKWGSHDFDPARFPDPAGMVKQLHDDLHTHIMISVWPKFYVGTEHYQEFAKNGWLYMRNVEKQEKDWVGAGYVSTFYDPYSQGARELFWKQISEKLFSKGFDAWWLDATEPDIHSNLGEEEYLLRIGPTAMGTSARYRNSFSLMNAKGIYEGQRQTKPDQRVFILTRSAYGGQQRYAAATWSGDVATQWYDLKTQIPAGLNFCLSGIPYWTTDIGGFAVEPRFEKNVTPADLDEWRELQTRWFQFGTFCPLLRVHGQFPYREMFNIAPEGHPAYETMLAYDKLRYRLMPYIYSVAGMVTQNDYTMMRALVMDFGDDRNVLNIDDQFMFGPALLVNPVTAYQVRRRPVYLPAGTGWYDLKTGQYYAGGQTIHADAPYTDIPLFAKAGSIIPFGPAIQYTGQTKADSIRLYVYTGQDGAFTLYEDEGLNYNYEKGQFSQIRFSYDDHAKVLTIHARQGQFAGMLSRRTFEVVWMTPDRLQGLDFDSESDARVVYDGEDLILTLKQ